MKQLQWNRIQSSDKTVTLCLSGELTRDTLLPLWQQRAAFITPNLSALDIDWDLVDITRIDSAGFALLIELIQYCHSIQSPSCRLMIKNVPQQILTLSELFDLSDWLKPFLSH